MPQKTKSYSLKTPAKINLGLWITGQRPNGYHELYSLFFPIALYDHLKITCTYYSKISPKKIIYKPSKSNIQSNFENISLEIKCHDSKNKRLKDLENDKNLIIKAAKIYLFSLSKLSINKKNILSTKLKNISFSKINFTLKKNIPSGAGLGGGSSDAAATLLLLNKVFYSIFTHKQLIEIAAKIGADVPFFINKKPSIVTGIGEKISPLLSKKMHLLILKPNRGVSTPEAYKQFDLMQASVNIPELPRVRKHDIILFANAKHFEYNALEEPAILLCPDVKVLKSHLQSCNAEVALMSGSGSSVFGIFKNNAQALNAQQRLKKVLKPAGYWAYKTTTLV